MSCFLDNILGKCVYTYSKKRRHWSALDNFEALHFRFHLFEGQKIRIQFFRTDYLCKYNISSDIDIYDNWSSCQLNWLAQWLETLTTKLEFLDSIPVWTDICSQVLDVYL